MPSTRDLENSWRVSHSSHLQNYLKFPKGEDINSENLCCGVDTLVVKAGNQTNSSRKRSWNLVKDQKNSKNSEIISSMKLEQNKILLMQQRAPLSSATSPLFHHTQPTESILLRETWQEHNLMTFPHKKMEKITILFKMKM